MIKAFAVHSENGLDTEYRIDLSIGQTLNIDPKRLFKSRADKAVWSGFSLFIILSHYFSQITRKSNGYA